MKKQSGYAPAPSTGHCTGRHRPSRDANAEIAPSCRNALKPGSVPDGADAPIAHALARHSETLRRLYTIAEVVEATNLSDSTIRRAIRLRHLAAIKVGGAVRLSLTDVDAWLDRNRRKAR